MSEESKFPPVEMIDDSAYPAKINKKKVTLAQSEQQEEKYNLIYKYNKSFELHFNREVIRFENGQVVFPDKYLKGFSKEFIDSQEFKNHSDSFVVKKIEG